MENERIQNPSIVKKELESMLKDQLTLNDKRTALLYSLGYVDRTIKCCSTGRWEWIQHPAATTRAEGQSPSKSDIKTRVWVAKGMR